VVDAVWVAHPDLDSPPPATSPAWRRAPTPGRLGQADYYYNYYRCALAVSEAMGSLAISGGSCANATTTNIGGSQLLPRPL
jgi:hypothetical protein